MKRKILSLLLSLCSIVIVFAAMPLTASAAESFIIPSTSSSVRMNGNNTILSSTKMNAISWNYRHYPASSLNLSAGTYYIRLYNSNGYLPTSVSGSDVISGNYVIYSNSGQVTSTNTTCNYISTDSTSYNAYFELKLTKTITDLEIYCQNNSTLGQNDVYLTVTKATYTVTLNNQSATTAGSTSATATYGSAMPSITVPTRTGYTFGGYYTSTGGGGTQYYTSSGTSARAFTIASATTLYAKWTANTYTVTLNNQSATTAGSTSATATYGSAMPSITLPKRTGYTFGGYYTSTNGGGTQYYYADGTSARTYTLTSTTTLYAKWTANTYTVTLNNQSATTAGSTSATATYGSAMPSITVPTRTGYTFGGYYTSTGGGGTQYYTSSGTSARAFTIASATTLYAKWTANTYTVTLNNQSATTTGSTTATATYGSAMPSITVPTKTGYTFGGYYTAANGGGTQYYTSSGTSARAYLLTTTTTLYAKWTAESKTITVSANPTAGGSVSGGGTIDYGTTVNLSATANTGYSFAGWYNGYTKVSDNTTYSFTATESIALEAKFELNTYTVSLVKGSGIINSGDITAYIYGKGATLPTDLSYGALSFAGWYEDNEFSGSPVTEIPANATGAKTYYAKWTASSVTNGSFVSFADSGYYSLSADAADAEKEGIIAFSTEFAQIGQYGNQVTDFGIWIYKAGASENEKVQLCKTDSASLEELKTNGGKFYATVEKITFDYISNEAFALPYIVIGGQVYFGSTITGTVNLSKWLGEKTAE